MNYKKKNTKVCQGSHIINVEQSLKMFTNKNQETKIGQSKNPYYL